MTKVADLLREMRQHPRGVSFSDALKVAQHFFGEYRISGSHHIFKTPWAGDPRINLQKDKGNGTAKQYQVNQLLQAVDKLLLLRSAQPRKETDNV